ncbi:MAG: NAD(+) synthase [Bacteroidetes bacterium]|nr:MAG: NAD(+) synthase [Bacteroidota bacterium]
MKKKATIKHIVDWLKSYCAESGMKGFVIGVSGGIDSALTSTLCALTKKPVIVLNMPILQNTDQYFLAAQHIDWLKKKFRNVSSYDVNLTDTFLKLKEALPPEIQDDHSMANTRSRLRMLTLYAVSTHHKMLVAGTGNKVEDFGVGFFTKYGDGGVDLSPIAGLMKSEVYVLAAELGVIKGILKAAPVDGLWADNRTDEEQIGATYEELEGAMKYLSSRFQVSGSRLTAREKKVLDIYKRFHKMNEHKMKPIPVCVIPNKFK